MADELKEFWAIVEVMGHTKYAGFISEHTMAGCAFIRIEIPEIPAETEGVGVDRRVIRETIPGFTKLLGPSSIFAITPVPEERARADAKVINRYLTHPWHFETPPSPQRSLLPAPDHGDSDDDDGFF